MGSPSSLWITAVSRIRLRPTILRTGLIPEAIAMVRSPLAVPPTAPSMIVSQTSNVIGNPPGPPIPRFVTMASSIRTCPSWLSRNAATIAARSSSLKLPYLSPIVIVMR
jgi:hypothetical protein